MQRQDLKYGTHKMYHFLTRAEQMDAIEKNTKKRKERSFSREECENSWDLDMRNNGL